MCQAATRPSHTSFGITQILSPLGSDRQTLAPAQGTPSGTLQNRETLNKEQNDVHSNPSAPSGPHCLVPDAGVNVSRLLETYASSTYTSYLKARSTALRIAPKYCS